jgi:hypothetical protein
MQKLGNVWIKVSRFFSGQVLIFLPAAKEITRKKWKNSMPGRGTKKIYLLYLGKRNVSVLGESS